MIDITVDVSCPNCDQTYSPDVDGSQSGEIECDECRCLFTYEVDIEATAYNIRRVVHDE